MATLWCTPTGALAKASVQRRHAASKPRARQGLRLSGGPLPADLGGADERRGKVTLQNSRQMRDGLLLPVAQ
eukprot:2111344-Pyramimonas_sp.AAC.1